MSALAWCPALAGDEAQGFRPVSFRAKDQLLIAGERGGSGDATQVVLLPGLGRTRGSWGEAARALVSAGYGVTSIDLRGHGGSGWPKDGDYSLGAFVEDLHTVLLRMSANPPVVVGASLGGVAALTAISERPACEIAGLVLVDILRPALGDGWSTFERFMAECEHGFDGMEDALNKAATFFPAGVTSTEVADLRPCLRRGSDGRLYWHWDPKSVRRQSGRWGVNIGQALGAAAHVSVPILLLTGVGGDGADTKSIEAFRNTVPGAQWIDVSAFAGNAPRPAMHRATAPLLRFMEMHWPVRQVFA